FCHIFLSLLPPPPRSTLFPYTTLFRSSEKPDFVDRQVCECSRSVRQDPHSSLVECPRWRRSPYCGHLPVQLHRCAGPQSLFRSRSEEHTSELQSRFDLVCRLLLEKKKN